MKRFPHSLVVLGLVLFYGCQLIPNDSMEPINLAVVGKTNYQIVEATDATEAEKHAAKELAEFLGRVTGAEFPVVTEATVSGDGPKIYVGWTEFAADNGIAADQLGQEEWVIQTVNDDLIITGGRPRGTLYGVYEFLEDELGCHWLDRNTEVVPSKPTLTVGPLNVKDKPWFWQRWVHSPTGTPDDKWNFMVRNKNYRYGFRGRRDFWPKGAFHKLNGYPGKVHSFSYFINADDHFETHPEYFSLVQGKRLPAYDGSGPGQLCLTNPEALRLVIENLRKFIAKDRREAAEKGCPPPNVYWFNQNDKYHAHCQCAACQEIAKREKSEAGPLIEFVNAMAEDIDEDYPDVLIGTLAYNLTSTPPKTVRPRDDVIIGWCDVYSKVDGIRPLKDPYNAENYGEITGWGKIAPRMAIGDDYWTALSYYNHFPTPYEIITCIASDIKLFADQGCESFFAEAAEYCEAGQQFVPLRFWLAYQLLVDPHQPVGPLIDTFMQGYYGPAAGKMREYMRYLRKRIDADAQFKKLRDEPHKLGYLDLEFFKTSERIFSEAQTLAKDDPKFAKHVRDERFILDAALLFMWPWIQRDLPVGETMPFDKKTVVARFKEEWKSFVKGRYSKFYSHQKMSLNKDGKLMDRMANLFLDPQLPKQFKKLPAKDVADFNWLTFSHIRPRQKFVPDDEAVGGMTATFTEKSRIQKAEKGGGKADLSAEDQYREPVTFGVTGGPTVTLQSDEIPQDGNYHIHKIGRIRVRPQTMVWALKGKRLGVNVDRVFVPGADDPVVNDWNAYISLKFQGPAYVKGSKRPNGVWMDRVLLVKPQPGEKMDAAYKKQLEQERQRAALRPTVKAKRISPVSGGDPSKVDWTVVPGADGWWALNGDKSKRPVTAKFAHDGEWFYVQLSEKLDPASLKCDPDVWRGDDWEILVSGERGLPPYRQIAINPEGKFVTRAYGEPAWEPKAVVNSKAKGDAWTLNLAFPLTDLTSDGVKPGGEIFVNILRGGKKNLVWSPTFDDRFHALERFGTITLAP